MIDYPKDISIILKGEEIRLTQKFLVYEPIEAHPDDPNIQKCIAEAEKNFSEKPESVKVKIQFEAL